VNAARFQLQPTCQGTAGMVTAFTGYAQLFQRLLGYTHASVRGPRRPAGSTRRAYFTANDLSDWTWVTVRGLMSGESRLQPYDLPTLRTSTTLALQLPARRVLLDAGVSRALEHQRQQPAPGDREPERCWRRWVSR